MKRISNLFFGPKELDESYATESEDQQRCCMTFRLTPIGLPFQALQLNNCHFTMNDGMDRLLQT